MELLINDKENSPKFPSSDSRSHTWSCDTSTKWNHKQLTCTILNEMKPLVTYIWVQMREVWRTRRRKRRMFWLGRRPSSHGGWRESAPWSVWEGSRPWVGGPLCSRKALRKKKEKKKKPDISSQSEFMRRRSPWLMMKSFIVFLVFFISLSASVYTIIQGITHILTRLFKVRSVPSVPSVRRRCELWLRL